MPLMKTFFKRLHSTRKIGHFPQQRPPRVTKKVFPELLIAQSKDESIYLNNLIDLKKVITFSSHKVDGVQWVKYKEAIVKILHN